MTEYYLKRISLFAALIFLSGCIGGYAKKVEGLSGEAISSADNAVKGVVGTYYARINYYENLTIEMMFFGLQERFAYTGKGWLTLVFRKSDKTKTLWSNYLFDSSKLKIDVGELKLRSSTPLNAQIGVFNVTELLNSTTDGVLFVTYDFTPDERYKPLGKLYFDGLTFNKKSAPAMEVSINNQELTAKVNAYIYFLLFHIATFEIQ